MHVDEVGLCAHYDVVYCHEGDDGGVQGSGCDVDVVDGVVHDRGVHREIQGLDGAEAHDADAGRGESGDGVGVGDVIADGDGAGAEGRSAGDHLDPA